MGRWCHLASAATVTQHSLVGQILTDCSSRALTMNTTNQVHTRKTTAFIPPMILVPASWIHGMDEGIYLAIQVLWNLDSTSETLHTSISIYLFIYFTNTHHESRHCVSRLTLVTRLAGFVGVWAFVSVFVLLFVFHLILLPLDRGLTGDQAKGQWYTPPSPLFFT